MIDLISAAMGLAQFAPKIVKLLAGDKAEEIAEKVLDVAKSVTGSSDPGYRMTPEQGVEFRKRLDEHALELEKLALANADQINQTMRAEAAAERWPTYSWRPFVGFCFGLLGLVSGLTVAAVYVAVMAMNADPSLISHLPGLITAEAVIMTTMAPVLGIASWFRGKMQADPAIPNPNQFHTK
jgi:hypothetical protein